MRIPVIFFLLWLVHPCYSQSWDWAQGAGGSGTDKGLGIDVDVAGNSYSTGLFTGTMIAGTYTLTAVGGTDVYVIKTNSSGTILWAFAEGGAGNEEAYGIACDVNGSFSITGLYSGTPTFGTTTLTSASGYFLAHYDASGNFQWAREFGSANGGYAWDVDIDPFGNSVVTGYFTGTETFGTTVLTAMSMKDGFVLRYDATGNFDWAVGIYGTSDEVVYAVNTDASGNIFVTGRYNGTANFGALPTTTGGGNDIFLAKIDTAGNFVWVVSEGNCPGDDSGQGVDVDAQGNVTITGYIAFGTAQFGDSTYLNSMGVNDGFVARYTNNGVFLWAKSFGGVGDDYGSDLSLSISGSIFVTGYFNSTVTFGTTTLTSGGGRDVLVLMYDISGNLQFALQGGGANHEYGRSIAAGGGYVYCTGPATGAGTYSAFSVSNNGMEDVLIGRIKYNEVGVTEYALQEFNLFYEFSESRLTISNYTFVENAAMYIVDMHGRIVFTAELDADGISEHNLGGLAAGNYLVVLHADEQILGREKFTKF